MNLGEILSQRESIAREMQVILESSDDDDNDDDDENGDDDDIWHQFPIKFDIPPPTVLRPESSNNKQDSAALSFWLISSLI